MKALIINDEIYQLHWTMLKSVVFILTLLPISQSLLMLWHATQGSSQIMLGFFAISLFGTFSVLCFYSALKVSVFQFNLQQISAFKVQLLKIYCAVPMLFLASILCYLVI